MKIETAENWASYDVLGQNFYLVNAENTIMARVPRAQLNPFALGKLGREKSYSVYNEETEEFNYKTERPFTYPRRKDLSNTIKTINEGAELITETGAGKLKKFIEYAYNQERKNGWYWNDFRIINNLFGVFANFAGGIDRATLIINRAPAKNYINVRIKTAYIRNFLKTLGKRAIIKISGGSDKPLILSSGGVDYIIAPMREE